ncbi:hypothetical protein E2562_038794 [Oryza meyeriana var. granulata]|uniref:Uncharacterized protein n=1 Tax=Oryza meyeriana var. granulata TaxID=110450 RepID=A0A6G1C183_9ORYZ|nr:hypothetical protein E2562_038794 [Oryza meyeriana var. granulata]
MELGAATDGVLQITPARAWPEAEVVLRSSTMDLHVWLWISARGACSDGGCFRARAAGGGGRSEVVDDGSARPAWSSGVRSSTPPVFLLPLQHPLPVVVAIADLALLPRAELLLPPLLRPLLRPRRPSPPRI